VAWYNRRTYPFFHDSALITSGPVTGYITNTEFKLRYNHTNNRKRQQTKRSKNMNPSAAAHQAVSPNEIYIDQTLYTGRPDNFTLRLPKEQRVYTLLDSLGLSYTRIDHDPTETIESCHEVERLLDIRICKNLFLCNAQKTSFYLLMMPGDKKFRTAVFSKKMGCSRLSFADAAHMEEYLDITPGSVSVLGLMNDPENHVRLVIDEDILKDEYIGCHPCINTSSLKIKKDDLIGRILPAIHHEYTPVELDW
jgi:Ala-tRNA(Pro) deacylase